MQNEKSHWLLKAIGIMPAASVATVAAITAVGLTESASEAFLMASIIWTVSSVLSGFLLWRAATKLERHGL